MAATTMDMRAMLEEMERMRKELDQTKAQLKVAKSKTPDLRFKVSEKGAVSVIGLNRFPTTLYKEQWIRLLDRKDDLLEFIEANNDKLVSKTPANE